MNEYKVAINELVNIAYGNCRLSKNGMECKECSAINDCKLRKNINVYKDTLIELIKKESDKVERGVDDE